MTLAVLTVPGTAFEVPAEIAVIGLIGGLTYALLGLGLALVYKTSRVLNFAHGEMGALPAVLLPILVVNHGWSYWLALGLALVTAVAIGGLLEFTVIRRLRQASRLTVLVATIGAAQLLLVINILLPKGGRLGAATYPTPFDATFTVGTLHLGAGHILTLIVVPTVTIWLTLFFARSRLGRASRAAAENLEAAQGAGIDVNRVSQAMWVLAGLLAVTSAILVGPTRPIATEAALGPNLMVRALGAAMLGGLTNLPAVFAGGVAIGVIEALTVWNYPTGGALEVVLFAVILVSLLARRGLGQLARGSEESSWTLAGGIRSLPPRLAAHRRVASARRAGLAALLLVAVLLPLPFSPSQRFFLAGVVVFAIMGLSLVVLTGYAGQISLGQFAFVGLGAAVGGRLIQLGHPHITSAVYAMLAGGLVALVVGLPALRIRGLFLAVATLAFAVAASGWMFDQSWLVPTGGVSSLRIPRPHVWGIDFEQVTAYYWLCLAVLVLTAWFVHRLRASGLGRALIAVRDNEPSAAALSVSPRRVKLTAFVVSGMIAALAGFLYGGLLVNFAYDPSRTFGAAESLSLVAMVIFGGVTTITGAVLGAFWVRGMPYLFGADIGLLSSGLGVLVILLIVPGGLAAVAFAVRNRLVRWLTGSPVAAEAEPPEALEAPPRTRARGRVRTTVPAVASAPRGPASLSAAGVTVSFGGNRALSDVSLDVGAGDLVGLMGPNGAGKTTLFDVLSGQLRPSEGRVLLDGADIGHLPPHRRAKLGIGRTFQQARLFDDLTVVECLEVAMECREPSRNVAGIMGLPGAVAGERRREMEASELATFLGLGPYAHRTVSELSTGLRRATELGCVTAMGSRVLLLDEPTAGFSREEVETFRPLLRRIRDDLGATVVVIDHHVPLMMQLVDRLYVLVTGEVVADGPPSILRTDARVVAAYFGETGTRAAGASRRRRRTGSARLAAKSGDRS